MDQNFKFGGFIANGNSCLDSVFRYSKVFRLHAIINNAAASFRSNSCKGPGYCYMSRRGPTSCLIGHVNGLLFCLYVKLSLLSIFRPVDFCSSMSLIVLDIELPGKNVIKEWDFLMMVLCKDFHFVHQRLLNLINRRRGRQVIYRELGGKVEKWIMRSCLLSFTTQKE